MRRISLLSLTLLLLDLLMARPVNAAAMAIAESAEGCVLHSYKDAAGVLTGGWGHVGPDVPPLGTPITQAQADAWRAADMARAAAFVEAHVNPKVILNDNQFSALAEFVYNVGVGNFLGSTLLRLLNQGNYDAVPAQLMRWNKAGGRVLPGLTARRLKEAALFAEPDHHEVPSNAGLTLVSPAPASEMMPVPSPPSLLERIRAWLFGTAEDPT